MNKTIRTACLRNAVIGTLVLVMLQLGCTQDQRVAEDLGDGAETPKFQIGAGDESDGNGNGNRDEASAQDGRDENVREGGDPGGIGGEIGGSDDPLGCVRPSTLDLTAGQHIDIGSVVISNDADNLYVTFEATDGWLLGATHVHVGSNLDDVPMTTDGKAIPGQFDYTHPSEGDAGVMSVTFVIPFAELDLADECRSSLHVWTHANSFRLDDGGTIIQQESAWGGNMGGKGLGSWSFQASYRLACCQ
jgi:hypothetical protein